MNLLKFIVRSGVGLLCLAALMAEAQNSFFKANNNDSLDLGSSWIGGTAPSSSVTDVAVWDAQVSTAANCSNTVASSVNPSWAGIQILNPPAPVKITSSSTLNLGGYGFDLNQPSTSQDLWLATSLATASDQTWMVKSGRTLTLGDASRNVNIQNVITPIGHISYVNTLQIQNGGTLNITNGTIIDPSSAVVSGAVVNIGANTGSSGTLNQSGGTLTVKRSSGTSGSPAASLQIASAGSSTAVYTITNGSLIDSSPADTAWIVVGAGGSANGTLNVDGTANLQLVKVLLGNSASAVGTMNISNGTVRVASTTFDVGRSSGGATGFVNVYGGLLSFAGAMNLGRGPGSGTLSIYGGIANLSGLNVSGANSGAGPGTNTITGGSLTITNSLTLAANGSAGSAEVNLNGGTLTVGSVTRGTGTGTYLAFNLNGGTLKPNGNSTTFIASTIPTYVRAGGAIIDTAGFNVTCAAPLLDGTGGGGLNKLGAGRLTLSGTNAYTGLTLVAGGSLYLNTVIHPGGPITVNDGQLLRTTLAASGTTMSCSALTLGSSNGPTTMEFDLGANANPTVPLVYATNLTAKGTVTVNVYGSGLTQSSVPIPLIGYDGSVSGGGTFALSLVQGFSGYVTNNTAARQVQLVLTGSSVLVWRASVNTNWDLSTLNWFDLSNNVPNSFSSGAAVFFDDSTSNALVNLASNMPPSSVSVNNTLSNYTFTGAGQISGVGGLTKLGSGTVTMGVSNSYSGATAISNGVFRLGTNGAIPANLTLEARLEMNGFNDNLGTLTGSSGIINNASGSAVLGLTSGTFAGQITNAPGNPLTLSKTGGGTLTLSSPNTYTGGTTNGGGTMILASEASIGPGPLTISGATLAWSDASPRTLTNKVNLGGTATFGNSTSGPLTVANTADFAGGGRTVNCGPSTSFPNGFTNGWLAGKGGAGDLLVRNTTSHNPTNGTGTIVYGSGNIVFDNCAIIQENGNVRLRAGNNGETCRLILTNGSSFLMTNTAPQNFRFNDGGTATDTLDILDLAGALVITPYTGSSSKLQMGSSADPAGQDILNLLPGGVLRVKQILDQSVSSSSTFNFNGGTLSPNSDELGSTFMQFLDTCYVLDGGAFIDTAGFNITIGQDLLSGGTGVGGLAKRGLGKLSLNGNNTYTGPTLVQAGALGGIGTISGSVTVQSGASLAPGAGIGTLFINNTLTLAGGSSTLMEISSSGGSLSSDLVAGLAGVTYGGTLVVTNIGSDALAEGNTFTLFTLASGAYHGSFAQYVLPSLPGNLGWDTSKLTVDGSITVIAATAPPSFGSIQLKNGSVVISGSGGTANGTYYVVGSTNVALPLPQWTPVATNHFDANGNFSFTNAVAPGSAKTFLDIYYPH